MGTTMKFVYTLENTFSGFDNYEGKHLCSAYFINSNGDKLLLPKMGKSILSSEGNIIFVHSHLQATATDRMYHDSQFVVRMRLAMCFHRTLVSLGLNEPQSVRLNGKLSFIYNNERIEIDATLSYLYDVENKIFKCIIAQDVYTPTKYEEEFAHKIFKLFVGE